MCVDCCLSGKNTYKVATKKENTTKSFVLRVDAATMDAIEKWAADEFRSTNGQLQWIINEALRKSGRLKKAKKGGAAKNEETSENEEGDNSL
ncbi:MAG TPA: DNA-binding protein [Bacteroides togonis]|nr:DNA-binding protein [Bacteroides togonis]